MVFSVSYDFAKTCIEGPREFSVPKGCKRLESCQYYASFSIDRNLDLIKVIIEAKQDDSTYTGIGVTEDEKMVRIYGIGIVLDRVISCMIHITIVVKKDRN